MKIDSDNVYLSYSGLKTYKKEQKEFGLYFFYYPNKLQPCQPCPLKTQLRKSICLNLNNDRF
jgi:hypothetical protein